MSGKIKAIAEQAKKSVPQGILTPDKWIEEYNRIFAELIVRECADFVDRAISDGGVDGRGLKEHFGVE